MRSMRARLLMILLVTTGAVWLLAAAWIYTSTQAQVEQVLDARLQEAARMVESLIADQRLEVAMAADALADGAIAESWKDGHATRQLSCQIWSLSGGLVGRSQSAPEERLAGGQDGFSETVIDGEQWRVYTIVNEDRGVQVMVGDNVQVRDGLVNDVMVGTLLPMTLILPIAGLLIWLSVRRGLAPLDRTAEALALRHADELGPIDRSGAPRELKPVLGALNGLFGRVAAAREREKSFTAFAAHELKTPLAGLKTQAQIARLSDDPQTRAHALDQIAEGAARAARLVRQLLDLAAADGSAEGPPDAPADLVAAIREAAGALEGLCARQGVTIAVSKETGPLPVACAPELVGMAVRNVLENAVLHSPAGGVVTAAVQRKGDRASVLVEDEGPGMDEADIVRAGERFFRGRTEIAAGTGLGLAIVEAVMQRCGGRVEIAPRDTGGLRVGLSFASTAA